MFVNVRTGTAALVSKAFPGSHHDIRLLRSHSEEVQNLLGDRKALADLGYAGAQRDVPGIVACGEEDVALRGVRVQVECFLEDRNVYGVSFL